MERETGIEPATNSLEGCDSTTELLPPSRYSLRATLRLSRPAYVFAPCTGGQAAHASRLFLRRRPSTTRCSLAVEQPPPHLSCFGCRTKGRLLLAEVGSKQPAHFGASVAEPKVASPLADEWLANRSSLDDPCERRLVAREGLEPSKPLGRQIYSLLRLTASLPRQPVCVGMPCFRQYVCAGSAGFDNALQNKPPDGAGGG